ncbi:MAG: MFS transporter [Microbacterium sp.]|uniref:MFS transporter n=1 Tax=Microbacterium sp. TaxID=51671 RepID=UPI00271DD577|nr:MFS transporter [Microbacterium sp.]MDO8383184.1 MFS transporter [Microbacterium sp.]
MAAIPANGAFDDGYARRGLLVPLSGLMAAQFAAAMSGTIVATSIPTLMANLEGPSSHAVWLVAATVLANTATTPIWGKFGDIFDPRRVLLVALGIFVVGTALAALSLSTTMLIGSRAVQGIGLGGVFSGVAIAIASLVGPRQRGRTNSWLSIMQTLAQLIAPVVGGLLAATPWLGWRWSFYLIFPIALFAFALVLFTLKLPRRTPSVHRTDYAGALLIAATVTSLLVCATAAAESGWSSPTTLITGSVGAVLLLATVAVETRAADPIVPFRLLSRRTPALVVIAAFCAGSTLFTGTVFASQYMQYVLELNPAQSGALLVPMALAAAVAAFAAGRYMSRTARIRPVLITGFASMVTGASLLSAIAVAPLALVVLGTVLVAAGLGMLLQNLVLAAQNTVLIGQVGTVSSTVLFFTTLGGTVALVVLGAVLDGLVGAALASGASPGEAYGSGISTVFLITTCIVTVGFVAMLAMPSTKLRSIQ